MATELDYAAIAARVYDRTVANRAPVPQGWTEVSWLPDEFSGFSAGVYRKGSDVVIAFTGTNDIPDWISGNIPLGIGIVGRQALQAAELYRSTVAQFAGQGVNITFTGHSLGGGLASVMGALFDKPATVFAEAPFQPAIDNLFVPTAIQNALAASGASDVALNAYIDRFKAGDVGVLLEREARITHYFVQNEVLTTFRSAGNTIEDPAQVHRLDLAPSIALAGFDRHSISLHDAFLVSPAFRQVVNSLPSLLPHIYDKSLFGNGMKSGVRDMLAHLLQHQRGYEGGSFTIASDGMLDRFTADAQRIFGRATPALDARREGLLQVLVQGYYDFGVNGLPTGFAMFEDVQGGLKFDMSRAGEGNLARVKAYDRTLKHLLGIDMNHGLPQPAPRFDSPRYWFVQLGTAGGDRLVAEGTADSDLFWGSTADDQFTGNAGDDLLIGGVGNDRYVHNSGGGADTIYDSDRAGQVVVGGGVVVTGGTASLGANTWRDKDHRIEFKRVGSDLLISGEGVGGSGDTVTVKGFVNGDLGIDLRRAPDIAVSEGAKRNPFQDIDFTPSTFATTVTEGGAKVFSVFLNTAAKAGETVRLALGALADKFKAVVGDDTIAFSNGQVDIAASEGQDTVTVALVQDGDVDADQAISLTATLVPAAGDTGATPVSTQVTLNVDAREEPTGATPQTTRDIIGDLEPIDFDPAQPGTQTQLDDLGNVIVGTTAAPDRADFLNDSAGNDHIVTGGGNDTVNATRGGDDFIEGGTGDDQLNAGPGDDRVQGGSGRDVIRGDVFGEAAGKDLLEGGDDGDLIYGMSGDDRIFGATELALQDAIAQGAVGAGSSLNGDFLQGLDGADLAVGTDRKDLISGGDGDDTLVAAQGDDYITGDAFYDAFTADWNVTVTTSGNTTTFTVSGASLVSEGTGGDSIHAGGGDDGVLAGAGDDLIYGEDGNDKAWGDAGDDTLLGGTGNDLLNGDNGEEFLEISLHGQDFLDGGDGNDELFGMGGSDALYGGAGDDTLFGDSGFENIGDDYLDGEDGNDVLVGAGGADTLVGGAGDDQLHGDSSDAPMDFQGDDSIYGEAGADLLQGYGGDDYLDGGSENDLLFGQEGDDTLLGATGDDQLVGDDGSDTAEGGNDYLDAGDGNDFVFGEGGSDVLIGGAGFDQLQGGEGDDRLDGGADADNLFGQAGNDVLVGGDGDDQLVGDNGDLAPGGGDDVLDGGAGADVLFGESGNDALDGGEGDDQLLAGDGDDQLQGGAGNDLLLGDAGNDALAGGAGADQLQGGIGDDSLDGGADDDVLFGEAGNDSLSGGDGSDLLIAGLGDDTMAGGQGDDFYFVGMGEGVDHIGDSGGSDWLILTDATLGNLRLDVGSLKLVFSGGGELHVDGWDPNNPLASSPIEFVQFADNTAMTMGQLVQTLGMRPQGTPNADTITGTALNDAINALAGNDLVSGGLGNDNINGGDGDDIVTGGDGSDTLDGGLGNDILSGDAGSDQLFGGDGADVLSGGPGTDTLQGGAGSDAYLFGRGDGQDTAIDALGANSVQITGAVTSAQTGLRRSGNDLLVEIAGTTDRLTVRDWFAAPAAWESVTLADGTLLDRAAVASRLVTNQAPVLAPDSASTFEDNLVPVTGNALANDFDPEGRTLTITNPGSRLGTYGSLTLQSNGVFSYSLNNASLAVQSLAQGQAVGDAFPYTATDNDPNGAASASSTITINIAGRNDAPAANPDFGFAIEDFVTQAFGNVLANDTDVDAGSVLGVAAASTGSFNGTYGTLSLALNGAYTYTLNNAAAVVQSLGEGGFVVDRFSYAVTDGLAQAGGFLDMTVQGINDAPVLSVPLADQDVTAGRSFSYTIPLGSFADADAGDVLSYSAALADGSDLPSWLTFDPATRTFSGAVPRDATGSLDVEVVAEDGHGNGEVPSSAADVFTITIGASGGGGGGGGGGGSQGNEGVGNGEDAPPPGHDHSFNDGEGTSPGNPGAKGGNGYVPLEPRSAPGLRAATLAAPAAQGIGTHGHSAKLGFAESNGHPAGGNAPQGQPGGGDTGGGDAFAIGQNPDRSAQQATDAPAAAADVPAADSYDPLAAQLAQDPQYDYAALLDWLVNEGSVDESLDPAEIARRWQRVATYAMQDEHLGDEARAAALGWQRFADAFAAANAGATTTTFGQFVGLGAANGLALESFRGLNEGLARL